MQLICFFAPGQRRRNFEIKDAMPPLLTARFDAVLEQGCEEVFSWAVEGGQSHSDMERLGLATVAVTVAWKYEAKTRLLPKDGHQRRERRQSMRMQFALRAPKSSS